MPKPSARAILKMLAANVHAKERIVLKCAVEMCDGSSEDFDWDDHFPFRDAVADYTEAARLLDQATNPA